MYLLTLSSAAALAAEETGAAKVSVSPPGADCASVADTTSCDHAALADGGWQESRVMSQGPWWRVQEGLGVIGQRRRMNSGSERSPRSAAEFPVMTRMKCCWCCCCC